VVETTGTARLYVVVAASSPAPACHALIELAKSQGGFKNIIGQILNFEGLDAM
jgi:hypothetical protein